MSVALFKVTFAGPLVSFQDGGRHGHMRFGVPASGPMDRFGYAAACAMLGQAPGTAIEVSRGGLALECLDGTVSCAIAGGAFGINADWEVLTVVAGDKLSLRASAWGSWGYLAFAGKITANEWLGHAATHVLSGLGGGTLGAGDTFEVHDAALRPDRNGAYDCPEIAHPRHDVRVVLGPQDQYFETGAVEALTTSTYHVTDAFDRMGMQLSGPTLALSDALAIASEPILRGAIQVAGDGVPVVLQADHQTTGGYPKIAHVLSADADRMAQLRAGDPLRFHIVSATEAVALARAEHSAQRQALTNLAAPRTSLTQRLMKVNLISGVSGDDDLTQL